MGSPTMKTSSRFERKRLPRPRKNASKWASNASTDASGVSAESTEQQTPTPATSSIPTVDSLPVTVGMSSYMTLESLPEPEFDIESDTDGGSHAAGNHNEGISMYPNHRNVEEVELEDEFDEYVYQSYGVSERNDDADLALDSLEPPCVARQMLQQFSRLVVQQRTDQRGGECTGKLTCENLQRHNGVLNHASAESPCYIGDCRIVRCNDGAALVQFRAAAHGIPVIEAMRQTLGDAVAELIAQFVGCASGRQSGATLSSHDAPDGEYVTGLQSVLRFPQHWDLGVELHSSEEDATISTPYDTMDASSL